MSAKPRVLGLLATIGLSLSLFGAAAANDSVPVSVELVDSTSLCAIDLYTDPETTSFGRWDYSSFYGDYYYDHTPGNVSIMFIAELDVFSIHGCDVTISFSGLSGPGGTIDPSHFSAYFDGKGHGPVDPASFSRTGMGAGSHYHSFDFTYTLESVPRIEPGTYTGQIDATVSNTP